jgi:hypothetical protein
VSCDEPRLGFVAQFHLALRSEWRYLCPDPRFTLMRKLLLLILLLAVVASAQKSVRVRTYTRKDGTVVHSHTRSAPGTKSSTTAKSQPTAPKSEAAPAIGSLLSNGTKRSHRPKSTAKHQFQASHPCPANGKTSGPCPGYVIDHKVALACGGGDAACESPCQQ